MRLVEWIPDTIRDVVVMEYDENQQGLTDTDKDVKEWVVISSILPIQRQSSLTILNQWFQTTDCD